MEKLTNTPLKVSKLIAIIVLLIFSNNLYSQVNFSIDTVIVSRNSKIEDIEITDTNNVNDNKISDEFEVEIYCGEIIGDRKGIEIIDTTQIGCRSGYAEYHIIFDNVDSLKMVSVELAFIVSRLPNRLIIKPSDKEFRYYDNVLTPKFQKYKFWKEKNDSRRLLSKNVSFYVHYKICGNVSN